MFYKIDLNCEGQASSQNYPLRIRMTVGVR